MWSLIPKEVLRVALAYRSISIHICTSKPIFLNVHDPFDGYCFRFYSYVIIVSHLMATAIINIIAHLGT